MKAKVKTITKEYSYTKDFKGRYIKAFTGISVTPIDKEGKDLVIDFDNPDDTLKLDNLSKDLADKCFKQTHDDIRDYLKGITQHLSGGPSE